jgi:mannose-6-phosphate isomerase-like protein (cupin superfamily)
MTNPANTAAPIEFVLPKQGERVSILSGAEAGAERLVVMLYLAPGAKGPMPHIHLRSREIFEIVEGTMHAIVDGKSMQAGPGERITVEPGSTHTFNNGRADAEMVVRTTVEPPLRFLWFFDEAVKSANRNGGSWDDMPLLEAAYIIHGVRDEYRIAALPGWIHVPVFALLAGLAVLLGARKRILPPPPAVARPALDSAGHLTESSR